MLEKWEQMQKASLQFQILDIILGDSSDVSEFFPLPISTFLLYAKGRSPIHEYEEIE